MPPKNQPPLIIKDKQSLMPVCQPWPGKDLTPAPQPKLSPQTLNVIDSLAQKIAERVEEKVSDLLEHMAPPVLPVLLTVKAAAAYLGRSQQAIQHLIFSHELPVVRVGRRVHLDRRDLDIWIEKNKI